MTTLIEETYRKRVAESTDTSAKVIQTCSVGDAWRQGDLEIRFLGSEKPNAPLEILDAIPRQLAPGESKGSRHVLQSLEGVTAYELSDRQPLEGPVLHCSKGLTVEHPEHGDVTMLESGWYAITYQRAFADEVRRVMD